MITRSTTRNALLAAATLLAAYGPARAASGWLVSYDKAVAESKKTGKPILADFTGSDWCGWCIKLDQEVFGTPDFAKWSKDNVVLLQLDFPQRRRLPDDLRRQNEQLKNKYNVSGFPTVLFLSAEGAVVGRSGYQAGGPKAWIASAQKIVDTVPKPAKPEKLELMTGLADAQKAAAEKDRPLLVLGAYGGVERTFKDLFTDGDFGRFANGRLVTVQVSTGAAPTSADGKALAALRTQHKLPKTPTQVIVLDPAGEKLLYSTGSAPKAGALTAELLKHLPKPAYDGKWLEDFAEAKKIATGLQRPILMDFTGSDWCIWCKKLDQEVFSKADFQKYAEGNLVLLKVDLPRQSKLPAERLQQNRDLAQQFGVRGFPTLVLVDAAGTEKGRIGGYPQGGLGDIRKMVSSAKN